MIPELVDTRAIVTLPRSVVASGLDARTKAVSIRV